MHNEELFFKQTDEEHDNCMYQFLKIKWNFKTAQN